MPRSGDNRSGAAGRGAITKSMAHRRPKPLRFRGYHDNAAALVAFTDSGHEVIAVFSTTFQPSQAKRLAAWLEQAANYLEPTP